MGYFSHMTIFAHDGCMGLCFWPLIWNTRLRGDAFAGVGEFHQRYIYRGGGGDEGKHFILVKLDKREGKKPTMRAPVWDPGLLAGVEVYEIPSFPLCPVKLYDVWRSWCPGECQRFCYREVTSVKSMKIEMFLKDPLLRVDKSPSLQMGKETLADLRAANAENVRHQNEARMITFMMENRQQGNAVQHQGNAGCTIL
jgi:hypothetical protein